MSNLIIGCDIDGTTVNMSAFNTREGKKFFKKEPVNPNAYSPKEMYGVSNFREIQFGLYCFNKYCMYEPPMENSVAVNNASVECGDEWHSITARKFTTFRNIFGLIYRKMFEKWSTKNGFKFKTIQYCSEKFSPRDKYLACKKLNVDVMIDDKPDVALYLAENGIKVLLVDNPYNQEVNHHNITRVKNWEAIKKEIDQIRLLKEDVSEYKKITKEEKLKLGTAEKVNYIKEYRNYITKLKVNVKALKNSETKFKLLYGLTNIPCSIIFKSKIEGKENIPYQDGFIIASNHLNSYDQFYISRALGNRQFCGFAASTIKNTIRGKIFKMTDGVVFIDRTNNESKEQGEEELIIKIVHDKIALIFPEGTRKNKDEEGRKQLQLPFKLGTVSIAQKTGTGIIPVSLYYGNKKYLKIGEIQFVNPEDDLVSANKKLEETISAMTLKSIEEDNGKKLIKKQKR